MIEPRRRGVTRLMKSDRLQIQLAETITWNLLVGTIIVLAGVALSERRRRPTLSRPEPAATSSASTVHSSAGPGTTRPP
jgi:hypothetical protein